MTTVRKVNLVVPLAHKATDKRIADTAGLAAQAESGAIFLLNDNLIRQGDVDSSRLTSANLCEYSALAAPHWAVWFGRLEQGRTSRQQCGFFHVRQHSNPFGRQCREPSGSPVPLPGLPTCIAALLHLEVSERGLTKPQRSLAMLTVLTVRENRTIHRALRILETRFKDPSNAINTPADGRDYLRLRFAGKLVEEFHAVWLDARQRIICAEVLTTGTLTQTSVYPREVVRAAIEHNAAAVIFAHNHPSGKADPSQSDIKLTAALKKSLALVDVRVIDHFIVTANQVTSLAECGHV